MTTTQNDLFAITQKNLYHLKDSPFFVTPDYSHKKTCHLHAHPMQESETRSFIVVWQLPKMENQDVDKPHS